MVVIGHLDFASNLKRAKYLKQLDVMVENAGLLTIHWAKMVLNEMITVVIIVGTYPLAHMSLPKLRAMAKYLFVTLHLSVGTSKAHAWPKFPGRNSPSIFEALNDKRTAFILQIGSVSPLFPCSD